MLRRTCGLAGSSLLPMQDHNQHSSRCSTCEAAHSGSQHCFHCSCHVLSKNGITFTAFKTKHHQASFWPPRGRSALDKRTTRPAVIFLYLGCMCCNAFLHSTATSQNSGEELIPTIAGIATIVTRTIIIIVFILIIATACMHPSSTWVAHWLPGGYNPP